MKLEKIPLITLKGHVIFPYTKLNFEVTDIKEIQAIEEMYQSDDRIFIAAQKISDSKDPMDDEVYVVGTICKINSIVKNAPASLRVIVTGEQKATALDFHDQLPFSVVTVEILEDKQPNAQSEEVTTLMSLASISFESYVRHLNIKIDSLSNIKSCTDINELSYKMISVVKTNIPNKQKLLEDTDPINRLRTCIMVIQSELEKLLVQRELQLNVKKNVDKTQRDYYLREHLKVIKEQLGETDQSDADDYESRILTLNTSDEIKEKLNKEVSKLKRMPASSQESNIVREYLEVVLSLPWSDKTEENTDLKNAQTILNEDHYALDKVKDRILEFLAVKHKTSGLSAPILCLVGPPGVGKTSIAKSIAKALNRQYVRLSLGGLHDESEIRGHRKTYLGAMPGRIISALRTSKKDNPLILLDEIDKIGQGHRGDPASALLEILDKEQSTTFRDNYVEIPYDISDVMFMCTANSLEQIPYALRDRLDIIQLYSYTYEEKKQIASKYLISKQKTLHGLSDEEMTLTDDALSEVIHYYTREAGVRQLERTIASLCRKVVKEILEQEITAVTVDSKKVTDYLGRRKFRLKSNNETPEVGVVTGLAWTSVGGDTLSIEVNKATGKGNLKLTGNIGKVMDESATAAYSFIRSNSKALGIDEHFYKKIDLHIHIPEGATPKDGPSAGITMATAMISTLSDKPVRPDVAMTGEITIRGKVLPIGGLKEKVIAAKSIGIKKVLLPIDNEGELSEVDEYIKEGLEFVLVDSIHEVLEHTLV